MGMGEWVRTEPHLSSSPSTGIGVPSTWRETPQTRRHRSGKSQENPHMVLIPPWRFPAQMSEVRSFSGHLWAFARHLATLPTAWGAGMSHVPLGSHSVTLFRSRDSMLFCHRGALSCCTDEPSGSCLLPVCTVPSVAKWVVSLCHVYHCLAPLA